MSEEMYLKHPHKFEMIVSDKTFLEKPSYQMDTTVPGFADMVKGLIKHTEAVMYIDPDKGNVDGNILGFGLAACQLKLVQDNIPPAYKLGPAKNPLKPLNDLGEAPRFGVVRVPNMGKNKPLALDMINPQILSMAIPRSFKNEGCLSFPGVYFTTLRNRSIKVGFVDANTLEPREIELYGLEAVILQHEVDHMDGTLFFKHKRESVVAEKVPGPNEPCFCGSGKKYKKCCME